MPFLRKLWVDLLIAAIAFAGTGVWATGFTRAWMGQGGQPVFYQQYFEPAVMIACGKGFVVTEGPRPQALEDFLQRRRDTFDCGALPGDLQAGREHLYQAAWIYLLHTTGWWWRVAGISWSGMAPLYGIFFGLSMAAAYAIFRLGIGRVVAVLCTLGLAISTAQLLNLPHLRDYSKAPFTLALILILGLLVKAGVRWKNVLALSGLYGIVLGIGYGFRTDFLALLPAVVITLFLFLDGGIRRNLKLKAAATLLFLAGFAALSWPVTSQVYQEGGCQWHVALLGLQTPFDEYLHVRPAPYDFGYAYADGYVFETIAGYARRTHAERAPPKFCTHEYDVASGAYLRDVVVTFPADVIARAYASVLQIVDLPFLRWDPPTAGWHSSLYATREAILRPRIGAGIGVGVAGLALLAVSAASLRLGCFALFFLAYFGGYPAVQFQERHYFHLEFIAWWALGFVLDQLVRTMWLLGKERQNTIRWLSGGMWRAATVALGGGAVLVGVLVVARLYQAREVRKLFTQYIDAPKTTTAWPGSDSRPASPDGTQYLEVDLDEARCASKPSITFRYDPAFPDFDFSRTVTLERRARAAGTTRVFLAVYEHFKSVEFSSTSPGCVVGTARFNDVTGFRLLLGATLPPEWRSLPLHQTLRDWERDQGLASR